MIYDTPDGRTFSWQCANSANRQCGSCDANKAVCLLAATKPDTVKTVIPEYLSWGSGDTVPRVTFVELRSQFRRHNERPEDYIEVVWDL